MNNNDILRRLRYTFDYSDKKMIKLFALGDLEVDRSQISNWLKKDDDPNFQGIYDFQLASFLNGLIIDKRGPKEEKPKAEKRLNNNIIFRKLKIAFSLRDDDILDILKIVDFRMGKHELSAFFRKPTQSQYRPCKDQILRNFIHGLQLKYHKDK
jgi:uncharacterized protein YehS (DUF1456 family)